MIRKRSYVVVTGIVGLLWACSSESKSDKPAPKKGQENRAQKPDPKTHPDPANKIEQPKDEPPRLEIGDCYGEGGDSERAHRARVTGKLREQYEAVLGCYKKWLEGDKSRHGLVTLSFTLDTTGKARGARAEGPDDATLTSCVTDLVGGLELGPADKEVAVTCKIAMGFVPVKPMAGRSKHFEIVAGKKIDWAEPGELPTIRAKPDVPAKAVIEAVAAARKAGIENIAFETERRDEWKYAFLPILPSAQPEAKTDRVELTLYMDKARFILVDSTDKQWKIPHNVINRPNHGMLASILKTRLEKPDLAHRTAIELAAADDVPYGVLAETLSVLAANGFTNIDVIAWSAGTVKPKLDEPAPKNKK